MANQQDFNIKTIKKEESSKTGLPLKKYIKIILGLLALLVLIIVSIVLFKSWTAFSKEKVTIEIDAPSEISSGELVEFTIKCKNDNRVAIEDAKITINYPQGAYSAEGEELAQSVIELGNIAAKEEASRDFKIRLAGERDSIKLLSFRLNYVPKNISSRFENFTSFKVSITSVLAGLYLTVPQQAISGERISYILDYINSSNEDFSGLEIELDYPPDFSFESAQPVPDKENNIWELAQLKQGERGTIKISGILEGLEGENKVLGASLAKLENDKVIKYTQTSAVTQISSSPLQIVMTLNKSEEGGNVDSGDKLNYKIMFNNNTDVALSQLILKAYLEGEIFDYNSVRLERQKGFFDSLNKVIIWSAAGAPSLALLPPGESGEVSFSLSVRDNFPINDFNDKNFKVSVRAELETLNVPPQFNLDKLKIDKILSSEINTKAILRTRGYYNETTADISNFGPIPPKVDQITTYTIHWQITNTSNDLENVEVSAVLPQGIEWRNVHSDPAEGSHLEFNERTQQLIWEIDKVPAATGYLMPAYELVFQVALRASITQVGVTPVLIDESTLKGKDSWTGEIIESFSSAIATDLPDDPSVDTKSGRVVK